MTYHFLLPQGIKSNLVIPLLYSLCFTAYAGNQLKNVEHGQCLQGDASSAVIMQKCATNIPAQKWLYNANKQLVNAAGQCLAAYFPNKPVYIDDCKVKKSREWIYNANLQTYKNNQANQCLAVSNGGLNAPVTLAQCANANREKWQLVDSPNQPTLNWLQHDLRLNGIGIGVESQHKNLFVPLGKGFDHPTDYVAKLTYQHANVGYRFAINGNIINPGEQYRFSGIRYGTTLTVQRYLNNALQDSYNLIFTNLPVLQLQATRIIDDPKSPGTFRLMSQAFKQDTGIRNMGIELHGHDSQTYIKKPYSVEIGSATDWKNGTDIQLLDLNKDNDWILDAVYIDTSFYRNLISQDIFRAIHPNAYIDQQGKAKGQSSLKGHLVEVIKNGNYEGVYALNEQPSRKMYDLQKIKVPVDAKGAEQWGKVDFNNPDNGSVAYKANLYDDVFFDAKSVTANFKQIYPKPKDAKRWEPLTNFANFVATADDAKFTADIGKWIDLDSVADWWALVLASHGEDNINHNFILIKSGSGKFFMVPWDHDGTFGVNWFAFQPETNNLIKRLTSLPATGFNNKLKIHWKKLRTTELSQAKMVGRFKTYFNESDKGGARARNDRRWTSRGTQDIDTLGYINSFLAGWLPKADAYVDKLP